jgi:ferredoxin-NADP reductase
MSKHEKDSGLFSETKQPGESTARKKEKWLQAEVTDRRDFSETLLVLTVRPAQPLSFQPGQYVKVSVADVQRRYSIVSAPHEECLEFCIERVPGGEMTPRVWNLQQGDTIRVRTKVKGKLTLDLGFPSHFMIATVAGIGPFVSMVRAYQQEQRRGHRFYLLYGASYRDEFAYHAELAQLATCYPKLVTYVPALSRPAEPRNKGWTGETGRISGLVPTYLDQFALDPRSTVLYACGHPDMVKAVKKQGRRQGFRVQTERYWKA